MSVAGKGGFECCNFNWICVLKLERGAVRGGECFRGAGALLVGDWLRVLLTDRAFPLGCDGRVLMWPTTRP